MIPRVHLNNKHGTPGIWTFFLLWRFSRTYPLLHLRKHTFVKAGSFGTDELRTQPFRLMTDYFLPTTPWQTILILNVTYCEQTLSIYHCLPCPASHGNQIKLSLNSGTRLTNAGKELWDLAGFLWCTWQPNDKFKSCYQISKRRFLRLPNANCAIAFARILVSRDCSTGAQFQEVSAPTAFFRYVTPYFNLHE